MGTFVEKRNGRFWVPNPAHEGENFADKWNEKPERRAAFIRWLETLKAQVTSVSKLGTEREARSAILKGFWPRGGVRSGVAQPGSLAVPSLAGQGHCRAAPWPLALTHKCSVRGWVYPDIRKGRRLWELTDRSVPKRIGLRFEATTNATTPYRVYWQVVNTGREAQTADGLRGGFDESNGGENARWETTAYAGTHWIEAFVVRNGQCVAHCSQSIAT
jgi:hypothetical protein